MQLKNKTVLLTGACGGIGLVVAEQLHQQGCQLILAGIDEQRLQQLNQSLNHQHHVMVVDLTHAEERQRLVTQLKAMDMGLDILINNAGIADFAFAAKQNPERLEKLLTLNLLVPMLLCQQFMPLLEQSEQAAIVNVGSTFGSIGFPGFSAYATSKFGLRGYTETLRRELINSHIRVMYLAPRAVKTPINPTVMIKLNKAFGNTMDEPEQVAKVLVTMLQKDKSCIYLGWRERWFIQMNSLFPRLIDHGLRRKLATIRGHMKNK